MTAALDQAIKKLRSGDHNGAEQICFHILAQVSDHPQALHISGLCAYSKADYLRAEQYLEMALSVDTENADLHNDLGLVRLANGHYHAAMNSFEQAVSLSPNMVTAHVNTGLAAKKLGDLTLAAKSLAFALSLDPKYAKANFLLGDVFQTQGDFEQAINCFKRAVDVNGGYIAALNHLSACLIETGRIDEALDYLAQALQTDPTCAETCCNLGNVLRLMHRFDAAMDMYKKAITLNPGFAEAHFNLGLVALLVGQFDTGWREYEWRLQKFPPDSGYPNRHGLPLWPGPDAAHRSILVYDEQGFGDVFMFVRFLAKLKDTGMRVVLETRPALTALLQNLDTADLVVSRLDSHAIADTCDCCIPLSSLAGLFHTKPENMPTSVPYLRADPGKQAYWAQRLIKDKPRIGLVWSGSNVDPNRRCALTYFRNFGKNGQYAWYGLQKDDVGNQAKKEPWLINVGPDLVDFSDTAAMLANLDLIISIDTATAHLAGAMGRPVWVLLPYVPDWRWFPDRSDSPWYPTMRLFRQDARRDWRLPIQQIKTALTQWQPEIISSGIE